MNETNNRPYPMYPHVTDFLKSCLRGLGIKNKDLAKGMNLSRPYITKLLNGDMLMHQEMFEYICKTIKVSAAKVREQYDKDFNDDGTISAKGYIPRKNHRIIW